MDYLDNDIKFVGGVGEARARLLDKELGIRTLGDMLRHYPFRYIDRTKVYRIAEITDDAPTLLQFRARVTAVAYAGTPRTRRLTAHASAPVGSAPPASARRFRPPPASTTPLPRPPNWRSAAPASGHSPVRIALTPTI